jgi:uncharacterized protein YjiK
MTSSAPPGDQKPEVNEGGPPSRDVPDRRTLESGDAEPGPKSAEATRGGKASRVTIVKLTKRQKRHLKDKNRPLDSWERYRALTDTLDEAIDLVDLADHKARFALVILAAVNVVLFLSADKLDALKGIPANLQVVLAGYLVVYIIFALYFFLQAIEALRPRKEALRQREEAEVAAASTGAPPVVDDYPLGIRFYEDVLRRDVEAFRKSWEEVRMGQLNAELAVQVHAMAGINSAKFAALRRLYKGLQIMTVMAVGLLGLAAFAGFVGTARKAAQPLLRGAEVLGPATRIGQPGVKEPSGIVFHAGLGRLFLVGDEGAMSELDVQGQVVRTSKIEQQIEDVAVHPPSGDLLLISEKNAEVILYDPVGHREKKRWRVDVDAVLGTSATEKNQGFEGMTFRPDPARPGGGVLYLTHQRAPAMIVGLSFDPAAPVGLINASSVVSRWTVQGYEDFTGITYVPSLDRFLLIADSRERILVLRPDGSQEKRFPLPGEQQEGLSFDDDGTLWIADDKDKSVIRVPDALSRIEAGLRGESPLASPATGPSKALPF